MRFVLALLISLTFALGGAGTFSETKNIVYTQGAGFPQKLDLYLPSVSRTMRLPGVVLVHGGGWTGGDKIEFAAWGRYLAARGYVCVSINYRLTPAHAWPAQIDDTQAAVRWMRKNAPALCLDPNRIGAMGASAGGHLVLLLGATETLNDVDPTLHGYSSRVQAVVDFYGPTDMTMPPEWHPTIWNLIVALAGVPWRPALPIYAAISPMTYVSADDSPCLIFHGDADTIVPVGQSRRIVDRMQSVGQPVTYFEFPGEGHGFTSAVAPIYLNAILSFFGGLLGD